MHFISRNLTLSVCNLDCHVIYVYMYIATFPDARQPELAIFMYMSLHLKFAGVHT